MTLSAVIIVLREVLEAAMVLSLLFSTTRLTAQSHRGIMAGFVLGIAGAVCATLFVDPISVSFDGVGQEVFNAVLLAMIVLLLILYGAFLQRRGAGGRDVSAVLLAASCVAVALALTREGTEIIIYIQGIAANPAERVSVLVGSAIGAGIGISVGVLIYYGLVSLPVRLHLVVPLLLLALVAAGMASQAVVYLMQGGLVESELPVWDSSGLVAETSITGQLLYALLGYEATPTLLQLGWYGATLAVFLLAVLITRRWRMRPVTGGSE